MRQLLGSVADFPEGSVTLHQVEGREIGVYNVGGELYAVLNVCPHRNGPICRGEHSGTFVPSDPGVYQYGLDKKVLRCPWHQWEYDLVTGRSLFGVARGRLRTYPVLVEDEQVFLETKGQRPNVRLEVDE